MSLPEVGKPGACPVVCERDDLRVFINRAEAECERLRRQATEAYREGWNDALAQAKRVMREQTGAGIDRLDNWNK